jgi:hypothetical protein
MLLKAILERLAQILLQQTSAACFPALALIVGPDPE